MSKSERHFSIRLSKADWKRAQRGGASVSEQIREDIRVVAALEAMCRDGMSDHPLGAMLKLAKEAVER